MKRRVGAVLARENRVVATGYANGILTRTYHDYLWTDIMAPPGDFKTAMNADANLVTELLSRMMLLVNVCAYTRRRMLY